MTGDNLKSVTQLKTVEWTAVLAFHLPFMHVHNAKAPSGVFLQTKKTVSTFRVSHQNAFP